MGTKEQVLTLFENNKGKYFSGEYIAENLSVSRNAVWKAVKSLRNEGYNIDAIQNKGYCLAVETDILSVQGIQKYLNPICKNMELNVIPTLNSTNTLVREKAAKLTTMAAVAACEAIEKVSGEKAQIKWVNDIFVAGKKVSGILTEASFGLGDGYLEYAVLGIGINVFPPRDGFPDELEKIAGAVFREAQNDGKNHLAAEFLNHFMEYYTMQDKTYRWEAGER